MTWGGGGYLFIFNIPVFFKLIFAEVTMVRFISSFQNDVSEMICDMPNNMHGIFKQKLNSFNTTATEKPV